MSTLELFARTTDTVDSTDSWCTPPGIAHDLGPFDLDVASNPRSHIGAERSYQLDRGEDGLALPWTRPAGSPAIVWCNGPYSDPLPWCERLRVHRAPWAALWKLDPTTKWFAQLMIGCDAWAPFRSRIKFVGKQDYTANFASFLVWGFGWQPSPQMLARLWPPSRGITQ